METLVECVPNFSEGRDRSKVEAIAEAIESVPHVHVLDVHMDADHHRSVITFVGSKDTVGEAAGRAAGRAAELIDMNAHRGEHPRIGAADVIPFVALRGLTTEDCVPIARETGREIWRRSQVPIYFYGSAAVRAERFHLAEVRRGGFEALQREGLESSSRRPDVGEPRLHPTAGATAVGARPFLIAFNVNLNSSDREVAREIARRVRAGSESGLAGVRAIGVLLQSRSFGGRMGQAQVAMNLTDFEQTSPAEAFEAVRREASPLGVTVAGGEIIGLVPQKALAGATPEFLQLVDFRPREVLENRLAEVLGDPQQGGKADPPLRSG